jgi:hypothetical protein
MIALSVTVLFAEKVPGYFKFEFTPQRFHGQLQKKEPENSSSFSLLNLNNSYKPACVSAAVVEPE